ncbi:hypothetical protein LRQ04_19165 [Paenarthrobacter sp. AR 02]|uniref:hypothetical protein n=1 Tax=Paenarthrobacter sp. AR 02 TaxID=2899821 RepID=UPI001F2CB6CE|nr:hypothetical protein [Paenarthrobacter sp. AR 02]MCF3141379.1 hypothetical protein [Paenarthrobacter sp. AR 02]
MFIHLAGDAVTISNRLSSRKHEYMPGSLLGSKLATFEGLESDEAHIPVDINEEREGLVNRIVAQLVHVSGKVVSTSLNRR